MFFSKQITQFIVAVQEGSFLKASEKISVTPSAMSRGVSELESKIGSQLIKRTRHGLQMTEKGKWLYDELIPHYNEIRKLTGEIKKSANQHCITIQTDGLYFPGFKEKLLKIIRDNPEIKITLPHMVDITPEEIFNEDNVDILISTKRLQHSHALSSINSISMKPEAIGLMVHKDITRRFSSTTDILSNSTIIQTTSTISHPFFHSIQDKLSECGVKPNFLEVTDIAEVLYLVNHGAGVSFMANMMPEEKNMADNAIFIEKPLECPIILQKYIYFRADHFNSLIGICSVLSGL
jgi:DNA-binding transcriptional LysR family regulator